MGCSGGAGGAREKPFLPLVRDERASSLEQNVGSLNVA